MIFQLFHTNIPECCYRCCGISQASSDVPLADILMLGHILLISETHRLASLTMKSFDFWNRCCWSRQTTISYIISVDTHVSQSCYPNTSSNYSRIFDLGFFTNVTNYRNYGMVDIMLFWKNYYLYSRVTQIHKSISILLLPLNRRLKCDAPFQQGYNIIIMHEFFNVHGINVYSVLNSFIYCP